MICRGGMNTVVADLVRPSPEPVTVEEIIDRAAVRLGLKLHLHSGGTGRGTGISGMTVLAESARSAIIVVPAQASEAYRLYVVGHEIWRLYQGDTRPGYQCQRTRWSRWRGRRREAARTRFATKLGVEVARQERLAALPVTSLLVNEAFCTPIL